MTHTASFCFTMGTKGMPQAQKEHLARILRRVVDERFDGNESAAARDMKIHQSQFNQIVRASGQGAGVLNLLRIRRYMQMTLDELLGIDESDPVRQRYVPSGAPAEDPSIAKIREAVRAELAAIRAEEAAMDEDDAPSTPPPAAEPPRTPRRRPS